MQTTQSQSESHNQRLTLFQRFGLFFYDRVKLTSLLWLITILFGVLSYTTFMRREGFPSVAVPFSLVNGVYLVNDLNKVDAELAQPLSETIKKIDGVKSVRTTATANFVSAGIQYTEGISSVEGSRRVEAAIKQNQTLPESARFNFQSFDGSKFDGTHDILVSVFSKKTETSLQNLETDATIVATALKTVAGVKEAEVSSAFQTGVNPVTGQPEQVQKTFDRFGVAQNGQLNFFPAATVGIILEPTADVLKTTKLVKEKLGSVRPDLDRSETEVEISAGFADSINNQVSSLQTNLFEGLIIVIVVALLLITWRAGLATALSMVTVLLLTIGLLYVFGITLNTISLFSLILCLGLIVDDTTIMVEAIDALKKGGKSKREIVSQALKRVARASTAGTLTTMMGFAPMLFIGGVLGSFIRIMPITIIISLAASLLISQTLIPFFGRWLLIPENEKTSSRGSIINRGERYISEALARWVQVAATNRKRGILIGLSMIALSFITTAASIGVFQKLKFDIFPNQKDADRISVNFNFPPNTTLQQAEQLIDEANQKIGEAIGSKTRQVSYLGLANNTTTQAYIDLVSYEKRKETAVDLKNELQKSLTLLEAKGVQFSITVIGAGPPKEEYPFTAEIASENTQQLEQITSALAALLQGQTINRANETSASITKVKVGGLDRIIRKDGQRIATVGAAFSADDTSALVTATQKKVETEFTNEKLQNQFGLSSNALRFNFGNESENQESFKSMLIAFPILLFAMFVLLAVQFRSLLQPLLIFSAIPFSFIGVALGLYATNNALSFFVMVGFFALIGIAVNNTILLTDYANQARREGVGKIESVAQAITNRFRPLLVTSITSVVALIPLALHDPFWQSLSVTLIFGLLASTILVILAFPYYLLAGDVITLGVKKLWRKVLGLFKKEQQV